MIFFFSPRTLIPILHQKAKRGTPHQAKQAVHCIHAIFTNKEVQLAQIFEVYIITYYVFLLIFILSDLIKLKSHFFFFFNFKFFSPSLKYKFHGSRDSILFSTLDIPSLQIRLYVQILHIEGCFMYFVLHYFT